MRLWRTCQSEDYLRKNAFMKKEQRNRRTPTEISLDNARKRKLHADRSSQTKIEDAIRQKNREISMIQEDRNRRHQRERNRRLRLSMQEENDSRIHLRKKRVYEKAAIDENGYLDFGYPNVQFKEC